MHHTTQHQLLRQALKEQYHAGLAMLLECVAVCPDDLWTAGKPRAFWRIAFHTIFYTHLYLGQNEEACQPWPGRPEGYMKSYDMPEDVTPYTKEQILDYLYYTDSLIDSTVDTLDLDTPESGFGWYKEINKLSHQLMNVRHIQGHVGQLSELLMARGIDTDWVGKAQRLTH